jgi:hypothetical protein
MKGKTKNAFDYILLCGIVMAAVFHLNSKLKSDDKKTVVTKPKMENIQRYISPDSLKVDSLALRKYMSQKIK